LNYFTHHNVAKQLDGLKGVKELLKQSGGVGNGLELRQVTRRLGDGTVSGLVAIVSYKLDGFAVREKTLRRFTGCPSSIIFSIDN